MQKADSLIRTKLRLPFIRPNLVPRLRLQEQIVAGVHGPLTLIIAPAGFGKTTLVASCIKEVGAAVAWLSLDKDDNQPGRFLNYLVAGLHELDKSIGVEATKLTGTAQEVPPEWILTSLINDLDAICREIVLVLDDYQFISSQAVHQEVIFLIDHLPSTIHLVIAARSDPPLPLARFRARGHLVELRAADLRFTEPEAEQFLNEIMKLHLDPGSVAALDERTEGWIAGLQMAALSIRDQKDTSAFIQKFSGTNRHILDYLLEEVLANQPPKIQQFLLCTSILERLSAPLCDAVLSVEEGLDLSVPSQSASILQYLDRENLFLIRLDDDRRWYRYHHLFADLLRARLAGQSVSGYAKALHLRASNWYEANGLLEEAIQHSFAAEDFAGAARQIEAAAENAWLNGQYERIQAWTKALPLEIVRSRPWLCLWNAWVYTQTSSNDEIGAWVESAEQAAENEPQDAEVLANEIAALKVFVVSFSRDYDRAIQLAEDVLKAPPSRQKTVSRWIRCHLLHILSSMYFITGQLPKTEKICRETMELAKEIGLILRYLHATNKLLLVYQVAGRLSGSRQIIEEARLFLEAQGYKNYFAAAQLRFREIELHYEWNRLDEAQRIINSLPNPETLEKHPYLQVDFDNIQAYLLIKEQDYQGAQAKLDHAKAVAGQSYIWEGLTWRTEWLQARLWLQKGDVSLAAAWAANQTEQTGDQISIPNGMRILTQARILFGQGKCREVLRLLDRALQSMNVWDQKANLIEMHVLKAIALQGEGEIEQALAEIERAFILAQPEGSVRIFIDEGQPMQVLLTRWLAQARPGFLRNYGADLLTQFEPGNLLVSKGKVVPNGELVESLSERELEVLQIMALGKTNQEIAQQFVVAVGTIKSQAASIYRKLEVANRTEAVAKARQLGILP